MSEQDPRDLAETRKGVFESVGRITSSPAFRASLERHKAESAAREAAEAIERARREADPAWREQQKARRWAAAANALVEAGFPRHRVDRYTRQGVPPAMWEAIKAWYGRKPLTGLVIIGGVGVGKTGAMLEACRALLYAQPSYWLCVTQYDDLLTTCTGFDFAERDAYSRARNCDMLVIDDLGAGDARFVKDRFESLINARWLAGKPTSATSNLASQAALEGVLGRPVVSRLFDPDLADVLAWQGTDDRRIGGSGWRV